MTKAQFYNGSTYMTVSVNVNICRHRLAPLRRGVRRPHNTFKLYIDGVLAATTSTTASISYAGLGTNTVIGRHGNAGTTPTSPGRSTTSAFTATCFRRNEVAQLYGLIGHWNLNQTSGTTATDSTIFGRNGNAHRHRQLVDRLRRHGRLRFQWQSHYFSVANAADFQPTGMISIAAWVKGDAWGAGSDVDTILRKGDANPNNYVLANLRRPSRALARWQ